MSFNYSKLKGKIKEVYGTQYLFAEKMGLSNQCVSNKLNNKVEWTQREIEKTVKILGIKNEEICDYFFCSMS